MEFQAIGMCPDCIQSVLDGEIEFTEPTSITEVSIEECINYTPEKIYLHPEIYMERIIKVNLEG